MADIKLEIKQIFDAPIENVWDAWTNPESLKQWKAPEGMHASEAEDDLREHGKYRIVMQQDESGSDPSRPDKLTLGGKFLEIEKPRKLMYTWLWEGAPAQTHTTLVTVLLNKLSENQTEVILIHSGFPDENMRDEHDFGWGSTLKKLRQFLTKGGE